MESLGLTFLNNFLDFNSALVVLTIILALYFLVLSRGDLPPGPLKLPVIGNIWWPLLQVIRNRRLPIALINNWQKHGDIVHVTFFGYNIVFLLGHDVIQDAFVKRAEDFSDRPHWQVVSVRQGKGMAFESGQKWKAIRRFTLVTLKDFGVGKTSLEEKILREVDAVTELMLKSEGKPSNYARSLSYIPVNVIYGIVFGSRLEHNSPEIATALDHIDGLFKGGSKLDPTATMPRVIWKLVGDKERYHAADRQRAAFAWIYEHVNMHIEEHRGSLDADNPRDFIDLFLLKEKEGTEKELFTRDSLYGVIVDLFVAGSETTASALNWCLLYMQEYPGVQKRCQEEISEKYGNRQISWADRGTLPYTEATLLEIQRLSNIAEVSLPHTCLKETTFRGYRIPKHSLILANLQSSNMDPKYWEEPELFRPERHLKDGKVVKNPAFVPFSVGPRSCPGDSLAKMELFLTLTNLLQRFTFQREDESVKHSFESVHDHLTTAPLPYKTRAIKH